MSVRFAPSPTGAFHVGNFRTAWIAREWARRLGVPWVVRFEDIDRPRVAPGAVERQTLELEALGLRADVTVMQSQNIERHWVLFERAAREGKIYPCFCSRKEVQEALAGMASAPHGEEPIYNGKCRAGLSPAKPTAQTAWRFHADDASGAGDFIVGRGSGREGFAPSYNWACAVDDYDGAHTLLVRASDLEPVAHQQRAIHAMLCAWEGARPVPAIFHCALVVADDGSRLEKRTHGVTLPELLAMGCSPSTLINLFTQSFHETRKTVAVGEIFGESPHRLTLGELFKA